MNLFRSKPRPPILLDDVRAVVEALRTVLPDPKDWSDVSFFMFGDGKVHLTIRIHGTKIEAKAATLEQAVMEIVTQINDAASYGKSVSAALAPFMNRKPT